MIEIILFDDVSIIFFGADSRSAPKSRQRWPWPDGRQCLERFWQDTPGFFQKQLKENFKSWGGCILLFDVNLNKIKKSKRYFKKYFDSHSLERFVNKTTTIHCIHFRSIQSDTKTEFSEKDFNHLRCPYFHKVYQLGPTQSAYLLWFINYVCRFLGS